VRWRKWVAREAQNSAIGHETLSKGNTLTVQNLMLSANSLVKPGQPLFTCNSKLLPSKENSSIEGRGGFVLGDNPTTFAQQVGKNRSKSSAKNA
jgi:hypothetical protein